MIRYAGTSILTKPGSQKVYAAGDLPNGMHQSYQDLWQILLKIQKYSQK